MRDDITIQRLSDALSRSDRPAALRSVAELVDVEHCDQLGMRALHLAVAFQDAEVVRALVGRGAQLEAETLLGTTPLGLALSPRGASQGVSLEVVRCLVVAGAKGEVPQELAHLLAQPAKRIVAEVRAPDQPRVGPAGQAQWAAPRDAEPRRQPDALQAPPSASAQLTPAERLLREPPLKAWFAALPSEWQDELAERARGARAPMPCFDNAVGLRKSVAFEEVTARKLMNDGLDDFHALLKKCDGGVVFIDEAYALNPQQNDRGREILEELLVVAETRREQLSIILAGYQRDMEQKLYADNVGLQSRIERLVLDDFTLDELAAVWRFELDLPPQTTDQTSGPKRGHPGASSASGCGGESAKVPDCIRGAFVSIFTRSEVSP